MSCPKTAKGYLNFRCTIEGKRINKLLHRVVAEYHIGTIDGLEINHKDFDKENNAVDNLEIVNRAENAAHYKGSEVAKATGRKISKIKTKYTPEEKEEKRRKLLKGVRGGFQKGHAWNPKSGRKKADDPTEKITFRLKQSILEKLPANPKDRNAAILKMIDDAYPQSI